MLTFGIRAQFEHEQDWLQTYLCSISYDKQVYWRIWNMKYEREHTQGAQMDIKPLNTAWKGMPIIKNLNPLC